MPGNFKKQDLRIIKTHKSLLNAMPNLLQTRNFTQLTVNDLCEEAHLSRTAFYMHFKDKYDLLEYWLNEIKKEFEHQIKDGTDIKCLINQTILDNKRKIKNLVENADYMTTEVMHRFIISCLQIKKDTEKNKEKHIVLTTFYAGGFLNFISWQIKKNFPPEFMFMNEYVDIFLKLLSETND